MGSFINLLEKNLFKIYKWSQLTLIILNFVFLNFGYFLRMQWKVSDRKVENNAPETRIKFFIRFG